jgi:hypothetical protein
MQPAGAVTGIAGVDTVIKAILSNDPAARRGLVRFLTTPCTTAAGLGGPPKCAAGEANDTIVETFPLADMEGYFARRGEIDRVLNFQITGLYGVYRVPAGAYSAEYWPAGDYALVFTGPGDARQPITAVQQTTAYVKDGAIVRLQFTTYAPSWPPAQAGGATWVLPPIVKP